jgi:hypothetical protein
MKILYRVSAKYFVRAAAQGATTSFSMPVLCLVLVMPGTASSAMAQDSLRFEYAVKVAINIHNPGPKGFAFRKKFALTLPKEGLQQPTGFSLNKLDRDMALEVDCTNPVLMEKKFAKGFAVIQSPAELDVVAVYTAAGATDRVETMHVERVPFRGMIPVPFP